MVTEPAQFPPRALSLQKILHNPTLTAVKRFFVFAALHLSSFAALHATEPFLVQNGQPLAEIVIAREPARMTKLAAKELQNTLLKMTGATLPVVTERSLEKTAIFVGMSRWTEDLNLSTKELKHGAFRMASGEGWLALLGADKDFVPIEPWGRKRDANEAARRSQAFRRSAMG